MKSDERFRIFISYSRRDSAIAHKLTEALEGEEFQISIDTRDLPFGEEWQKELSEFIHSCDTVIWLVSSSSVTSRWVKWELGEVQRAGKRLIPVVIERVTPEDLPEAVGKIHLLPANDIFDPKTHLTLLVEALRTDHSWLRENTRLGQLARTWEDRGRRSDHLLVGKALHDAEEWRASRPNGAVQPNPTIFELLAASQTAAKRRLRRLISSLSIIAIALVGLAAYAFYQQGIAVEQQGIAVEQKGIAVRNERLAIENERIAVANEKLATERSARLSVGAAKSLREEGLNHQALLVLLEAAKQFDDETVPVAMRIEFEKALKRATHEQGHTFLPAGSQMQRVGDGLEIVDANGSPLALSFGLNHTSHPRPKRVDCAKIYRDPRFLTDTPEAVLRAAEYLEAVEDHCETIGDYLLFVRRFVGPHVDSSNVTLFHQTSAAQLIKFRKDLGFRAYDWTVIDDHFQLAYLARGSLRVEYGRQDGIIDTLSLPISANVTQLGFAGSETLVTLGPVGTVDGKQSSEILVTKYDLNPPPLSKPINVEPGSVDNGLKNCTYDEARDQCVYKQVSADGNYVVELGVDIIQVSDSSNPGAPFAQLSKEAIKDRDLQSFYQNGPSLIFFNKVTHRIERWTPPENPESEGVFDDLFSVPPQFDFWGIDPTADRIVLAEQVPPETMVPVSLYSISARQVWQEYKVEPSGGNIQITPDGNLLLDHSQRIIMAELSDLTQAAQNVLQYWTWQDCMPEAPADWPTSDCWPD